MVRCDPNAFLTKDCLRRLGSERKWQMLHENTKVAGAAFVVMVMGSVTAQAGYILAGVAVLRCVFGHEPGAGFSEADLATIGSLAGLSLVLMAIGAAKGRRLKGLLESAEIVPARVLRIEEDSSRDHVRYRTLLEYEQPGSGTAAVEVMRNRNDLLVGQSLALLVSQGGYFLPETDLPGGMALASVYGSEPLRNACWIRVLAVPALSVLPLLGLVPQASALLRKVTAEIGSPFAYQLTVAVQAVWLFANWRYFHATEPRRRCPTTTAPTA
jgi:hypothetical protein